MTVMAEMPEKHNQGREDVEGVREPQREANYAHGFVLTSLG